MLKISNLNKHFADLRVFEQFNLAVPSCGFTVLIGPSGCGKSTLFDVLMGAVPKDRGKFYWQNESVANLASKAAYMQQNDLLLPWFSLLDNALLPARIVGSNLTKANDKALDLFRRLKLNGFESYHPQEVSGGMRQRCALVRTLMFEHDLVLLDEPLSALDAITRRSLQSLLLLLQVEFHKTILMITHDIEEALLLADELVVLTHRPMSIREKLVLEIPKPRQMSDPRLVAIKDQVIQQLEKELNSAAF